ncbi:NADPH-dependent FMN reductase [Bacillus pseudomycoides]|uniref:NADPH-dependent FMN reductase n=1 Tax=Bacillus pseudomycoides TaxID=64104 RepID=UPI002E1F3C8B|nr:NAD(P)H-dependent oxidoreductase [Bacillus pseudomycoides]
MKLLGISGDLVGKKTANAVNEVLMRAKKQNLDLEIELIDVKNYHVEFVDGRSLEEYNDDTKLVVNKILDADFFIIGTPVYQASITRVLKNLFDHLPIDAFKSKVVGMITLAGTSKHFLVGEMQLKPILSFFKAIVASNNVFIPSKSFNEQNQIDETDIIKRIDNLVSELLFLQNKLKV